MALDRTEKVLFLVTIDTECDHDPRWVRSKPLTFRSITEGLPERLQPAFDAVGAIPTYLLTVEVLESEESVRTLRGMHGSYEYGTHLHSAFIEPEKKFIDYAGVDSPDFQCHCAAEIEYRKLESLTRLFEERFGYRPRSFRAGRFGAGPNTVESLGRLGYRIDTSVTPYIRWRHPDGDVDYRAAPEQPYFPSPGSLTKTAASGDVLEIPVTLKHRWFREPSWLRPWYSTTIVMRQVIEHHLAQHADRRVVVLNMMFHSMEVIAKASPYPQTEDDVKRFIGDMSEILSLCRRQGMMFVRAADVYPEFAANTHGEALPRRDS
jgi:hypothetical protein